MKKIWLSLAPCVLMIAFLFCGCGPEVSATQLSVDCGNEINMIYGTYQDEPAYARVVTNKSKNDLVIDYDSDIIDYNILTGKITANHTGKTELKISTGGSEVVVQVNVVSAFYCTFLNINSSYTIKMYDEPCKVITPVVDDKYNMGFDFISQSPEIVTIDENGLFTPVSIGEATIEVRAKSGVGYGGYQYIYETAKVTVEDIATELKLEILDKDLQPLDTIQADEGFDYYELYSSETADRELYVLKMSSNIVINGKYFSETGWKLTQSNNGNLARLFTFEVGNSANDIKAIDDGGKVLYRPFYATGCGIDYFQYSFLDVALNYQQDLESNLLKFKVYKQTETVNVNAYFDNEMTKPLEYTDKIIPLELENEALDLYFAVEVNDYGKPCTCKTTGDLNIEYVNENFVKVHFFSIGDYTVSFVPEDKPELSIVYTIKVFEKGANYDKITLSNESILLDLGYYALVNYKKYDRSGQEITEYSDLIIEVFDKEGNLVTDALLIDASYNSIGISASRSGMFTVRISNEEVTTPATLIVNVR